MAKQPASFGPAWRAAIGWPLAERLAALPHRVALLAAASDLFGQCLDEAALLRPGTPAQRCGDDVAARAAAIRAALASQ